MKQNLKERPHLGKLVKGYLGFLTGTGKSLSTVSSYQGDLKLLESFLKERKKDFYGLNEKDFGAYLHWLEKQGLKTNTRRRKILSAKALVKYAVSRKKLAPSKVRFVKAPDRLERLPWIPQPAQWKKIEAAALEKKSALGLRNALLVGLLAETGMTVAELCGLKWDQIEGKKLNIEGNKARVVELSSALQKQLQAWQAHNQGKHLFPGFNRHGITSQRMTPRGVELYFRNLAKETGFRSLKPKTLRHFAIASWLRSSISEKEIQRRLGVHANYSFEAYHKHLQST